MTSLQTPAIEAKRLRSAIVSQEKLVAAVASERRAAAERERLALRRLTVLRMRLGELQPAAKPPAA